jgi:hypothetical protein
LTIPIPAGSSSQLASDREAPIVDIAKSLPFGYFTSEYLNTRARLGLVFFHNDKAWKILHISDQEIVFALPFEDLESIIQRNKSGTNEKTRGATKKSGAALRLGIPATITQIITLESFRGYIIIHTTLGTAINTTFRLAFDAMLTEQDLIRGSYNDSSRILFQTTSKLTREEIQSIGTDLFHIPSGEFDRLLAEALDARFPSITPLENQVLKKRRVKTRLQGKMRTNLDVTRSKTVLTRVANRKIRIATQFSTLRPTPRAKEIIDKYERMTASELDALIIGNVIKLKRSIERESVVILCLNCQSSQGSRRISDFEEKPKCQRCGSRLLALPLLGVRATISLLRKKKASKLNPAETSQLVGTRRTADLVLSYGKRAIIALSITGIGPQTASSILALMSSDDSEFYYELLKAKIHYLTTRELWDRRQRPATSSANRVTFNN